jgi:hypothetical protein
LLGFSRRINLEIEITADAGGDIFQVEYDALRIGAAGSGYSGRASRASRS